MLSNKIVFIKLIFIVFFFLLKPDAYAQLSEEEIKIGYIYKFAKSLEWPQESSSGSFVIAVLQSDKLMYSALKNHLEGKMIKAEPIKIKKVSYTDLDKLETNILFIQKIYNNRIDDIVLMTEGRSILRVTDELRKEHFIMINFVPESGSVSFELSPIMISSAKIKVSQELLLSGGSEIDIISIYKEMEDKLKREMARVEAQTKQIERQQGRLNEQLKAIGFQSDKILEQRNILKKQREGLRKMQSLIDDSKRKLEQQDALLIQGQEALFLSKRREASIRQRTEDYRKEIENAKNTLERQKKFIKKNQALIEEQLLSLNEQESQLRKQKYYIYAGIVAVLSLAVVIYFVVRTYRIKHEANKVLSVKNLEITSQKKKLEEKTSSLDIANRNLEYKNYQIESGIRYALAIQSAVLPSLGILENFYKSFILFRPKDIVSGDFFWFTQVKLSRKKFDFVAVVDCTGHGVPGAFMSFVGNWLLNDIINKNNEYEPKNILTELHQRVYALFSDRDTKNKDGMVLSLLRLEQRGDDTFDVVFSGAKQSIFIMDSDAEKLVKYRGDVKEIGSPHYDMIEFSQQTLELKSGSIIYMFSDGIIDQNDVNRKKIGTPGLKNILSEALQLDIALQKDFVTDKLEEHMAETTQRDDMTLLGMEL